MTRESGKPTRLQALLAENTSLRSKLEEAEETLRAIREGEVDAIVVSGSQGDRVFSLTGAESVYRLIVETMKEAALTVTTDGRILFCNGQFGRFVQTPPERILGRPLAEFVVPDQRALVPRILAKSQAESVRGRLVFQGAEGPLVPAHVSVTALCQADSVSICLVATDLTELEASTELLRLLQREQAALRESETEFRAFFDTAAVGATELGLDGRFVRVNDRYCALTGFSREELLGMTPVDLAPPEDRAVDQARVAAQLRESSTVVEVEKRYVRKDGRVIWVRVSAAPIRDAAGRPLRSAGIIQDVTARKNAEEALLRANAELERTVAERTAELSETVEALEGEVAQRQQAEVHLQQINQVLRMVSAANEAVVRIDDEGRLMQEICRIAVEVGGYRMAWVGVAEDDADRSVRPIASTGVDGGYLETARITWADTERGRGPTGTAIRLGQVQIATDFFTEPRLAPWCEDAIKRGFRSSIALPLREGEAVFGALTIYAAEPAAFPDVQVKVLTDLAEDLAFGIHAVRVRTALHESRDQLRALAAELTLAEQRERRRLAEVLHDGLQQLLVAARVRAHMLGRSPDPGVHKGSQEIVVLLEEALAQSRALTGELRPPTLQKGGMLPALEWLSRWMGEKHRLTVTVRAPAPLPALTEDVSVLLYQAVRELLLNTVKYAQVSAADVTLTQTDETLTLTVADAGVGFDSARLRVGGGTEGGFGLFSIRERLELLGGRLEIVSHPGQGSRFTLVVPLRPDAGEKAVIRPRETPRPEPTPSSATARPADRRTRVLVVDDHALVRRGFATLLAGEPDLDVVGEAADGKLAIELARQLVPDVILMDVSMPILNGIEATRAIHGEFPATRIIGLSVFDDPDQPDAMRDAGAVAYVRKNDPPEALLAAIRGRHDPT